MLTPPDTVMVLSNQVLIPFRRCMNLDDESQIYPHKIRLNFSFTFPKLEA
jgi:hypothetical protein